MFEPYDYARIMKAGQDLVPNLLEQGVRESLAASQGLQAQTGAMQEQRMQQGADEETQREGLFQRDLNEVLSNPTYDGYSQLMARHPQHIQPLQKSWETMDAGRRDADFQQTGALLSLGVGGHWDKLTENLERRVAADREAGDLDDTDDEMLAISRGDETQRRRLIGVLGLQMSIAGGLDKAAPLLNSLKAATKPNDFEEYAQAQGFSPGTPEYAAAMEDYVLRSSGPSATEYGIQQEENRQENRVDLEGVREGSRSRLEALREGARTRLEGLREGARARLEGLRQGNRVELEGTRETNRRGRPARPATISPTSVIGRIMDKQANGVALTPGETRVWTDYEKRGSSRGGGRRGAGGAGGGTSAARITGPNGRAAILKGGKWVDEATGKPL